MTGHCHDFIYCSQIVRQMARNAAVSALASPFHPSNRFRSGGRIDKTGLLHTITDGGKNWHMLMEGLKTKVASCRISRQKKVEFPSPIWILTHLLRQSLLLVTQPF